MPRSFGRFIYAAAIGLLVPIVLELALFVLLHLHMTDLALLVAFVRTLVWPASIGLSAFAGAPGREVIVATVCLIVVNGILYGSIVWTVYRLRQWGLSD